MQMDFKALENLDGKQLFVFSVGILWWMCLFIQCQIHFSGVKTQVLGLNDACNECIYVVGKVES